MLGYRISFLIFVLLFAVGHALDFLDYDQIFHLQLEGISENRGRNRVVIFGSSFCNAGIRAGEIEDKTGMPAFNTCRGGRDNVKNLAALSNILSSGDILLYGIRQPVKEKPGSSSFLARYLSVNALLPQINFRLERLMSRSEWDSGTYLANGDLKYFPRKSRVAFPRERPQEDLSAYEDYWAKKLADLRGLQSERGFGVIVAAAPILTRASVDIYSRTPGAVSGALEFIAPLQFSDPALFLDSYHVNQAGRDLWTAQILERSKQLKQRRP